MTKNSKDKNDLRRIRQETGIAAAASGAVFIIVFAILALLTELPLAPFGVLFFLLHCGVCVGAYFFFEKQARRGAVDEIWLPLWDASCSTQW